MSIRKLIAEEAKRGPLALSLNILMAIVAIASLVIALNTPGTVPAISSPQSGSVTNNAGAGTWLFLAICLATSMVIALLIRLAYKVSPFSALPLSLIAASLALSAYVTAAVRLGLDGPKAAPLAFALTTLTLFSLAGRAPIADFMGSMLPAQGNDRTRDAPAALFFTLLACVLWAAFVWAGYRLVDSALDLGSPLGG